MNYKLKILFLGANNVDLVYQTVEDFGYDVVSGHVHTPEKTGDLLYQGHWDILIAVYQKSEDLNKVVVEMSQLKIELPWILVCDDAGKGEILKFLDIGCSDVIGMNEIGRLGFVIYRLLVGVEEIRKNKVIQEGILSEKRKLELTFGSIGDGIIRTNSEGKVVMMNSGAETITGWPADLAINKPLFEVFKIIDKNTKKPLDNLFNLAMNDGETTGLKRDTVLILRNGEEKYVSACISPIKVADGIIGMVIVFRDITRIRQAEESLEKYRLFSENTNDIIIFSDIDGRIIEINSAALRAYGYTREEILNKSIFDLMEPSSRTLVRIQPYNSDVAGIYYEATARRKDGNNFDVEIGLQSAKIGQNKVLLSIQRDITEREQTRKELEEARVRAETANLAKSEFLANMSHEIRTPLNGMLGMIDLTLLTDLTESQRDNLFTAKSCATSLLNLINDILDFSKIEAGELGLENISFNLGSLVEQVIKPHSIKAEGKGLRFEYRLDSQMPQFVNGDPNRLKQVLNNLLGNAVKFTDAGEITLSVTLKDNREEFVELEFQISDTGVGIAPEDMERIFGTFSQADNSITRRFGGSGLGLAISKQLVKMMGGSIRAESEKGKGSTFYFAVKLVVGELGTANVGHDVETIAKTKQSLRVLLAEDDEVNQIVTARMLREAGHIVEIANNGTEALHVISRGDTDVVLMDIQMPGIDGIEAVRRIRKDEKGTGKRLPIIAFTAYALQGDREKYLAAGMDDYIPKPVQINDLLKTLERVAERSGSGYWNGAPAGDGYCSEYENIGYENLLVEHRTNMEKTINNMVASMALLEDAFDKGDLSLVERHAHEIKKLSETAGIGTIKNIIFKLELAARREDLNAAMEQFSSVIEEFNKFREQCSDTY
ncbi:MAG TPA: PAS domain S-box protein [Clostridia bacterium]|nr:PAS domain S-box protein [Clostridia bacterium]